MDDDDDDVIYCVNFKVLSKWLWQFPKLSEFELIWI